MSRILSVIAVLGMCIFSNPVTAQLTMYDDNGPSDNRIDFLILSEGYTAGEAAKFQTDATYATEAIFGESPFREYRGLFNIGFGFIASNQSGADATPTSNSVSTALECYFWCNNTDRLICCNGDVWGVAAGLNPAYDQVLVIVNSTTYGGSGGGYSTTSMADGAIDIPAHEFGHSLGNLADEYTAAYSLVCGEDYANITQNTDRATLKWGAWVDPATPLPTTNYTSNLEPVGAFQGGCYSSTDYYRPVWNCMMQSLGSDFCPVCSEQLIRSFYGRVAPVDSWLPVETALSGTSADTLSFTLETLPLTEDTITVSWSLDGAPLAANSDSLDLPLVCIPPGAHTLVATASDGTSRVRIDPEGLLTQEISWTINRTDSGTTDTDCVFDTDTDSALDSDSSADTATGSDADSDTDADSDADTDTDTDTDRDSEPGTPDTDSTPDFINESPPDDGCGCRSVGGEASPTSPLLPILLRAIIG